MAILEVNNLYKSFGKTEVLRGIDFSMERGEVLSIIGSSGGGKTTLCNLIRGLIPHFYLGKLTGECLVEGKDIREWHIPSYQ